MSIDNRDWNKTIFLAHASEDKTFVKNFYVQLLTAGLQPWLDSECLGPGMEWDKEIKTAIKKSRFFMAFFSSKSVNKDGYIQREFRRALSELEEKPPGFIYFIPAFTEANLELPDISVETVNLRDYQAVNISTPEKQVDLINYFRKQIGAVERVIAKESLGFKEIREHISNGQIDRAFHLLKTQKGDSGIINNDIILLMGRFNSIKKQNMMGVITPEQYTIQNNQIVYALLEMISVWEEDQ